MWLLLLALTLIAAGLFYKYVERKYQYWKDRGIAGPSPSFLTGNFGELMTQKKSMNYFMDDLYTKFKGERFVGIYRLLTPQLMILDTDLCKEIFVKNFRSFHDTSFAKMVNGEADPLLAFNPFFLAGEEWKNKRSEITPAFSPARIKTMYPLIEDVCGRLTQYLKNNEGKPLEARDLCSRFTTEVVSSCIFGADAQAFVSDKSLIREKAKKIFDNTGMLFVRMMLVMFFPALMKLLKVGLVPMEIQNFFKDLMAQAITQRRKGSVNRADYLDYLLQLQEKKGHSDIEVAANAITFFIDGLDTSAVGISGILYELARNKDAQVKLRQELSTALEGKENLDYEVITELEYLDYVFYEGLRLHPPAGFNARECTEPIELEIRKDKKVLIEKGMSVIFPIWSIHRDPNIYDEPLEFRPERMAGDAFKRYKDQGEYLTFGDGPRTCLGQRFAATQGKACIAEIVQNFEIDVDKKTQLPLQLDPKEILTYPIGGFWLCFTQIKQGK